VNSTNNTFGIDESIHPPFRATPSGFSVNVLLVTQGCATFAIAHVAPPWADLGPPLRGFWSKRCIAENNGNTSFVDLLAFPRTRRGDE